ncbi:MAG TPA: Ig-like domain-containing protein, partial [Anaerolineales bacterium]
MSDRGIIGWVSSFFLARGEQQLRSAGRPLQLLLAALLLAAPFVRPAPIGAAGEGAAEAQPAPEGSAEVRPWPEQPAGSLPALLQSGTPPPNDDFDAATEIGGLPFSDSLDTAEATQAPDDPELSCAGIDEPNSVWYRFTPSADTFLQVDTFGSDQGMALGIFTGPRGSLTEVACNSQAGGPQSAVQFQAQAGVTYSIEVIQFGSAAGGTLQLNAAQATAPENDDFDGAAVVPFLPFHGFQFTNLATSAPDDPVLSCGKSPSSAYSNSVWFHYAAPADGGITVEIQDADYDTIIAAWTGVRGELLEIGCNDREPAAEGDAYLTVSVAAGEEYWIEIVGQGTPGGGLLELEVWEAFPPLHDDFDVAVEIAELHFFTAVDTSLATTASDDPAPSCGAPSPPQQSHSVWYRYTPAQPETIEIGAFNAHSLVLALWTGQRGALSENRCFEFPAFSGLSPTAFLEAGTTYWLEVAHRGEAAGGLLEIDLLLVPPPANDDFDDASLIPDLPFSELRNDTRGATVAADDPEPSCGAANPQTQSNTVWYAFTPAQDGAVMLHSDLSSYETLAAVWTGTRGSLDELACAHDPGAVDPFLEFPVQAGVTHFIELAQFGSPAGGSLRFDMRPAPHSACLGAKCTFYVASGSDDAGSVPQLAPLQPCTFNPGEGNLYLGQCTNGDPITSGFRFSAVDISPGSLVLEAYLEFVRDGPYSDALDLAIHAEDSSNPDGFSDSSRPDQRPLIPVVVPWLIPATEFWDLGEIGRSPDIGALVQTVIDRPDWVAGNSLALIVTNSGPAGGPNLHRRFLSYERAFLDFDYDQPRLVVTLGVPDPDQSTVLVEPPALVADGVDSGLVTVTVRTATGIPLPNVGVELQATPDAGVLINGAPAGAAPVPIGITDANGIVTATIASSQLGAVALTALVNGMELNQAAVVHFVTRITDPSQSTLAVEPTTLPADGTTPAVATVTLLDAAGLPVALHQVELQATGVAVQVTLPDPPVTDANGVIVGQIRSVEAGLATIRAVDLTAGVTLDQAVDLTFTLGSTDPDRSTVAASPLSLIADGIEATAIVATLVDNQGRTLPGHELRLSVSGSDNTIVGPNPATTDAAGQAAWTLSSTKAEVKTLSVVDQTAGLTLAQRPQVTFNPGPLAPDHSKVTPATLFGVADGVTPVSVVVRANDAFDNPIPGLNVQLFITGSAIVTQPAGPTDDQGRATGTVVDTVAGQVTLSATIAGQLIPDQGRVTFRGAELSLAKAGQALSNYDGPSDAFALAGGTITYTLSVTNQGPLDAAGVEVVDTLPAGLTFAADLSGLPHQVDGQSITWQVGNLPAAGLVEIAFEAGIDAAVLGLVSNSAAVTTTTTEFDPADNAADLDTTVEAPRPVMKLSPAGPTLTVMQGESAALTATLRNSGAAEMTGIQVTSPPNIPWVSLNLSALTDLAPRSETTFTVTASAPAGQTPGLYRDFVVARDDYGNEQRIALTVKVETPRRQLQVVVENDQGARVPGAIVNLVKQEASVVVTEGAVQTYHESAQVSADSQGIARPGALQIGGYDVSASAPDHNLFSGSLTVAEGAGVQTVTIRMAARGRIELSPDAPLVGVVRGQAASRAISIVNRGAAPLTGLTITPPSAIPWVTLGLPDPLPVLQPGESTQFSILASPALDQSGDIFQGHVTVAADSDLSAQLALTVQLTSDEVRDTELQVVDGQGQPVTAGGSVVLLQQELTTLVFDGETRTFNQQFTGQLDASGRAAFPDLEPGAYNFIVSPRGYTRETGEIVILAGTGVQSQTVAARVDPFRYSWTVVPIEQGYDITLTMTFDVASPDPALAMPEVCWPLDGGPTAQVIKVFNPSGIPLTIDSLTASLPGASLQIGSFPSVIGARQLINIPVTATKTGSLGTGSTEVAFSWDAAPDKFVTFSFNPSSLTSPLIYPGVTYVTDYVIRPVVFDPGTTYTLEIGQPSVLDWISLVASPSAPMRWDSSTEISVRLTAATPEFLAEGVYTDSAPITVTGNDGTMRQGSLDLTVTQTGDGMFLHTSFTLGVVPTVHREASASGTIGSGECAPWEWESVGGDAPQLIGHFSGSNASFPGMGGGPVYDFGHQQVRVELSQKVMLEGESFKADLDITNTSGSPIENVSVHIRLTDQGGADKSWGFDLIPDTPTALGTIGVGAGKSQTWFIQPMGLGVGSPDGEVFLASAAITYTHQGVTSTVETVPERITVYPAPDLVISYQLPLPTIPCNVFPLKVTIHNRGEGPARNLRFSTAQPRLVDPSSGLPITFKITGTTLNGEDMENALNLSLGDLPAGGSAVIVWTLESSIPGRFVEFTSDYRQSNFLGVPLSPLISEIHTDLVPGACAGIPDWAVVSGARECSGAAYQGTYISAGGPINTRTGGLSYLAVDLSLPTAFGPLTFERWYASRAIDGYTETLGFGWTHSLDTRLYFPDDPQGQEGAILLKLHSANRYAFVIQADGSYAPYPGVCGSLTRDDGPPTTYTFVDTEQQVYRFDQAGRLLVLSDPQGHRLRYLYDGDGA